MNAKTGVGNAHIEIDRRPLLELLQRARLSKHITGEDRPAETEAARAAYAKLGKLAGR